MKLRGIHLRYALRSIARLKVYAIINILGLSLGMCACIVIYLITRYELGFDAFHPDKERIYRIGGRVQQNDGNGSTTTAYSESIPGPAPATMREQLTGLDVVAGFYPFRPKVTIREAGKQERTLPSNSGNGSNTEVIIAEPSYFSIFSYDWLAGNPAVALREPYSVVLSEHKASRYFGALPPADLIGREVIYNDSLTVKITGIVRDWQQNTDLGFTDFISFGTIKTSFLKNSFHADDWRFTPGSPWISAFVKRSPDTDPARLSTQLQSLFAPRFAADSFLHLIRFGLDLQPLQDVHFNSAYSDGQRKAHLPTLYNLLGIAGFILLLASINFINLSTGKFLQRARETAVRKVLGSRRIDLVFQFLTEAFLLSFVAVCLAVLMVRPALAAFHNFIPAGITFHLFDPSTILFVLAVLLVTSLLSGFYPAWLLSSYLPAVNLKGMTAGTGSWNVRKSLIVFQFTISLVFIMCVIVVRNQIHYMLNTDMGFRTHAVLTLTNQNDLKNQLAVLAEKIRQLPGVEGVALQGHAPMGDAMLQQPVACGCKEGEQEMVSIQAGTADFIPFYGMKMLAGRNILPNDSLREFVINETYSRNLGFIKPQDALGVLLVLNKRAYPVVGVVADFHDGPFSRATGSVLIGHIPDFESSIAVQLGNALRHESSISSALAKVGQAWKETYPEDPFSYRFLDDSIAALYKKEQQTSWLMTVAMSIAIFISCVGLLGVATFTAERRTREIGIRKVLGASATSIAVLLSMNFVKLICLSIVIASPIAYYFMHNWLQDFAYRIRIGWWMFFSAGSIALLISLLTVSVHTVKAALANPVKSLKVRN